MMKNSKAMIVVLVSAGLMFGACAREQPVNMDAVLSQSKSIRRLRHLQDVSSRAL